MAINNEQTIKRRQKAVKHLPNYTLGEELVNSISHGLGALFSVAALIFVVIKSVFVGNAIQIVAASLYGASLIMLYSMSTIYHALARNRAKRVFQIFDHCTIYFLIAGSYTPFCLITLNGAWGWSIFGVVWGVTALGVTLNAVSIEKFRIFSGISYLAMGWAMIVAIKPLIDALSPGGLWLLFGGGIAYTLGFIFYALKIRYMHGIWHVFVLAGSVLHFFAIYLYVIGT